VIYHPSIGTYELPPEHAVVLAQDDSPYFLPLAWNVPASMWFDEEKALEAFRTGKGIRWDEHHDRLFCGVGAFYRNGYATNLVPNWIPALDGVENKLREGATVAHIGCGYGHSTILMAETFPRSRFRGFDYHPESIRQARANADKAGMADRVKFDVADAKSYPAEGFDLICFFDSMHEMGDPIGAAEYGRSALGAGGTVMLVEPFAHDRVEDNLNTVGRLYYSASTTICCAHSLAEEGGLALGAQAGEARVSQVFRVFRKAGFTHFAPRPPNPIQPDPRSARVRTFVDKPQGAMHSRPYLTFAKRAEWNHPIPSANRRSCRMRFARSGVAGCFYCVSCSRAIFISGKSGSASFHC
jgi:SAM-dependent methyltransferase